MANKDRAEEQVKALFQQLEQGIQDVFTSENYLNFLQVMSRFHHYSARNCMLIFRQKPDATHVAGYNAWKTKFHRYVRGGEKGIQILGYAPRKVTVRQPVTDGKGNSVQNPDGTVKMEPVELTVPTYVPVYVFDVSQTGGDPLPQLTRPLEDHDEITPAQFQQMMKALKKVAPVPIVQEELPLDCYGLCTLDKIIIRPGLSNIHTLKTTIHEVTHSRLHAGAVWITEPGPSRPTREIQAESVAFLVCAHYGLDTSDYSFPYVATWSTHLEPAALMENMDVIQKEALAIISEVDSRLVELDRVHDAAQEWPTSVANVDAPAAPEHPKAILQSVEAEKTRFLSPRPIQDVLAEARQRSEAREACRRAEQDVIQQPTKYNTKREN